MTSLAISNYYSYYGIPGKYEWILVTGAINAFFDACGIGANDMANSFGTVYGSKVLNKWQIVALASVCEFTGAMVLGKAVTKTISSGITNVALFKYNPYCLMWGFSTALAASTSWLYLATYHKLPVSTTHSIVGGIIGFSIVFGGSEAVIWKADSPTFPYITGFVVIVMSWITSPIFSAVLSSTIYGFIRRFVLQGDHAATRATYCLPLFVSITFFIEAFLIITKGAANRVSWYNDMSTVSWVSAVVGAAAGTVSIGFIPFLNKWRIQHETQQQVFPLGSGETTAAENNDEIVLNYRERNCLAYAWQEFWRSPYTQYLAEQKIPHSEYPTVAVETGVFLPQVLSSVNPDDYEKYSPSAEYIFRYLQVFTAICASFAHGSNDVANAAGSFSGILYIYNTGYVGETVMKNGKATLVTSIPVEQWVLAMSAGGIVVGLATYGLKIMELLGADLTYITPIRGFSAELSAAWVVTLCSAYGMPVSTTQCITGAVIGVALVDVPYTKLPWHLIAKIFTGWIATILIVGCLSAALYAVGLHTPVKYSV